MSELDKVPEALLLRGEGLREMAPSQYATFCRLLDSMGIEIVPFNEQANEAITLGDTSPIKRHELSLFAKEHGYNKQLVERSWNVMARVGDAVVRDDSSGEKLGLNPTGLYQLLLSGDDDGITNFGSKSRALVADFINHRLKPEAPLVVNPENERPAPEPIPAAEEFVLDESTPFIEKVDVNAYEALLVSVDAIKAFARSVSINPGHLAHLMDFLNNLADATLPPELQETKEDSQLPTPLTPEIVYIRNYKGPQYFPRTVPIVGLEPHAFVKLINQLEAGVLTVKGYGPMNRYTISRYINAICENIPTEQGALSDTNA